MTKSAERQPELHQLLPVESNLQGLSKQIIAEAAETLRKKERFMGSVKRLEMFDANRSGEEITEVQDITTTVADKLAYVQEAVIRYYDAYVQKEATNQNATADLVIDDKVICKDVPATALLGLETRLKEIRNLYNEIPTLPPGIEWKETDRSGVYKQGKEEVRMKTEKTIQYKEVSKATDKFPAQVEKWTADVPVGRYISTTECSMLPVSEKSRLLGRIDRLIQAVMEARMRANSTPIVQTTIGKGIFDYINNG